MLGQKIPIMLRVNRRNILRMSLASLTVPAFKILEFGFGRDPRSSLQTSGVLQEDQESVKNENAEKGNAMKIQYLEIVTADVD